MESGGGEGRGDLLRGCWIVIRRVASFDVTLSVGGDVLACRRREEPGVLSCLHRRFIELFWKATYV